VLGNLTTTLLSAVAVAVAGISAASAADLPMKAAPRAPVVPAYSWAGCYIVGNVGGGLVGRILTDDYEGVAYGRHESSKASFVGGAGLGCNMQTGSFVYGIEGDFNWTNFKDSHYTPGREDQHDSKWDWFSTLRARFGLANDRTLFYMTAGVAWVDASYRSYDPDYGCNNTNNCAKLDKVTTGMVAGVGAEYAFTPNWTFRAEYLALFVPNKRVTDLYDTSYTYSFSSTAHLARVGLAYKFGGGF
jgi:outer membrane immunogenic protein